MAWLLFVCGATSFSTMPHISKSVCRGKRYLSMSCKSVITSKSSFLTRKTRSRLLDLSFSKINRAAIWPSEKKSSLTTGQGSSWVTNEYLRNLRSFLFSKTLFLRFLKIRMTYERNLILRTLVKRAPDSLLCNLTPEIITARSTVI